MASDIDVNDAHYRPSIEEPAEQEARNDRQKKPQCAPDSVPSFPPADDRARVWWRYARHGRIALGQRTTRPCRGRKFHDGLDASSASFGVAIELMISEAFVRRSNRSFCNGTALVDHTVRAAL
jgi:hypothetical protein